MFIKCSLWNQNGSSMALLWWSTFVDFIFKSVNQVSSTLDLEIHFPPELSYNPN